MRLYLIRHADPDYFNNTITEFGHKEAEALAVRLSKENLTRIYSSPMGRAQDTMRYTANLLPQHVPVTEDWTAEFGGTSTETAEWGRIAIWDLPGEVIRGQEEHPSYDD